MKKIVFIAVLSMLLTAVFSNAEKRKDTTTESIPPLGDYSELYIRNSYDILHMIKCRELGKIGLAAKIAAQRKMAGGKIWSFIGTPHIMYSGACDETMPGNPNIAPDYNINSPFHPRQKGVPELGAGDFLIIADPGFQEERKKGCYVLGVGFPMPTNKYSPPNFNDHPETPMETQVDMMIYTWGPKEDGIVTPTLTPHLKILPTSPMTVVAYWLIMAQISHNLAYNDTTGTYCAAEAYIDTLMSRLDRFHSRNILTFGEVGEKIAEKILSGGKLYIWSSRWEFYEEASGTAGSVMGIYPIFPAGFYSNRGKDGKVTTAPFETEKLTDRDVVILGMAGNTPQTEIDFAKKARDKKVLLVGIYPFKRDDGFSTGILKSLCNYSYDNLSGDMDGVLSIPGYPKKIIPTVTSMNNYAFWSIMGAYIQAMEKKGVAPYYWMSWHVPGGKAYTDSIHPYFIKRGY